MALVDATTGLEIDNFSVTVQNVLDLSGKQFHFIIFCIANFITKPKKPCRFYRH
jgi:hypothetical protein